MIHMSRSRISSGPVDMHTASATDLPSALAVLQRLATAPGDGWRRLVVDLSSPLDPIREVCGRALGRRVVFKTRAGPLPGLMRLSEVTGSTTPRSVLSGN